MRFSKPYNFKTMLIFLGPIPGTATIQTKSLMHFAKPYDFKTMTFFLRCKTGTATIQTKSLMHFAKPYNFKTMTFFSRSETGTAAIEDDPAVQKSTKLKNKEIRVLLTNGCDPVKSKAQTGSEI
jgi:hypothetical protein